jgi:hypothetical protein
MKNPITRKPVQAGDYGKDNASDPVAPAQNEAAQPEDVKAEKPETDGRKTLALWSR